MNNRHILLDFLDYIVYTYTRIGAVAQLGERLSGRQEVVGSIPISSTS